MKRGYTISNMMEKKIEQMEWNEPWQKAFAKPEPKGVWFIWGNSANGKSSFIMQLTKELSHHGKVFYNSLEEGIGLTMQQNIARNLKGSTEKNILFGVENMSELNKRLLSHKAPRFVIIDSFQYTNLSFPNYLKFKETHADKLIIFTSQAQGKQPSGRTAQTVRYDADLKIWVEGFKAISNGRYNPGGDFTIWQEGAEKYWGINDKN